MQPANQPNDLEDVGRRSGKKRSALHLTALKHFKDYLAFSGSEFSSLDQIPENLLEDKILGYFSDYISKEVQSVNAFSTHNNYVSAIHCEIVERFPLKKQLFASYYKTLNENIWKEYKQTEQRTGIPIVKHSTQLKMRELDYICRQLFAENSHELRAWLALDWMGVGRASEVIIDVQILFITV